VGRSADKRKRERGRRSETAEGRESTLTRQRNGAIGILRDERDAPTKFSISIACALARGGSVAFRLDDYLKRETRRVKHLHLEARGSRGSAKSHLSGRRSARLQPVSPSNRAR